ncbi:phosphopantetheine-binding protein [Oceanicoccus sp. KOV_DT_Chl]|uniref:phosphopantetheine-binding protein n=1 Tax=Oceanicoccus sp. KOV_DT_Chl TaxID=1904639 RepID=UPI000C798E94|nr:phosphopantetheine-binding protein [Oceanicoccus sp. KOV_DT_Chl]
MSSLVIEVKQLIIDSLDLEDITVDDIETDGLLFGDGLGLDSIDALELGLSIHKKFDVKLDANSEETKKHFQSVASLVALIESQR